MNIHKYLVVLRGEGSLSPDPLKPGVVEHALPGLHNAVLNLAEPAVDAVANRPEPPIAAVLALWLRRNDQRSTDNWDADRVAASVPWNAAVYPVAEQSQWGHECPHPIGARIAGVKRMAFVQRRPDLTSAQFAAHWADVHGPLAKVHHPTLVRYTQNVVCGPPSANAPAFAGVGELHFPSATDYLQHRYDSDAGEAILRHDVGQFLAPNGSSSVWVGEYPLL